MSHNLIDIRFEAAQLAGLDAALTFAQSILTRLIAVKTNQRRKLARMGHDGVVRAAIRKHGPQILPPNQD